MKVSVVIPAHNEEERIQACLKSVFNQTVKPFEVIVVDNNSTDRTSEISEKMGARVLKETTQGQTYARNKGFNSARGEIIARTDADTIVSKDWIEKIESHFKDNNNLVAISGSAVLGHRLISPIVRLLVFEANKRIFGHVGLYGPNLALRKSAWDKIKNKVCLNDERVHEDLDLAIHIGTIGPIKYVSDIKVRTSARRLRTPSSILLDYVIKWADTIASHKKYRIFRNGFSNRRSNKLL